MARKTNRVAGKTVAKQYTVMRQASLERSELKPDQAFEDESEEEYSDDDDLSDDMDSSEEEFEMLEYDNDITRDIWMP